MPGFEAAGLIPFEKDDQSMLNVIAQAVANMIVSAAVLPFSRTGCLLMHGWNA
jgi:hypothetical protein